MTSPLPPLNEDCFALILSHLDNPSLISLASTSHALHKHVQPALVRAPKLSTSKPGQITAFCALVTSRSLAPAIHDLTILHNAFDDDPAAPFRAVLPALAEVLKNATSLTSLRIPIYADDLLDACPALAARAPTWRLELGGLDNADSAWLAAHPPTGLHTLSLGFTSAEPHFLKLAAPSAHALLRLSLTGAQDARLPLGVPAPGTDGPTFAQLRMLSVREVDTSLAALAHYFPNVHFVDTQWVGLKTGQEAEKGVALPALLGANGAMDGVLVLLTQPGVRIVRLNEWFTARDEFTQFTRLARRTKLASAALLVNLNVQAQAQADEDKNGGEAEGVPAGALPVEYFFRSLVAAAPELSYAELNLTPWFPHRQPGDVPEAEQWEAWNTIALSAFAHLSTLAHLEFLVLRFPQTYENEEDTEAPEVRLEAQFGGLAACCLEALPQVKYALVELYPFTKCVARGGRVLEPEDAERLRSWYQWEGADARLAGIKEWLDSVENL